MHEDLAKAVALDAPDFISAERGNPGGARVYIETFGCQMNKLDTEIVEGDLLKRGYCLTSTLDGADVYIVNTCSVRQKAENRLWDRLKYAEHLKHRVNPQLVVGVMGCVAQQEKENIFDYSAGVNFVAGTEEFVRIGELLDLVRLGERDKILATQLDRQFEYDRNPAVRPSAFQAYLSAMRGCDKFCTYCVVPYTRGREVSRKPATILEEARRLAGDGVVEITVLGQRIETYGRDLDEKIHLGELLLKIAEIDGIERVKFLTGHPTHMRREIFEAMAANAKLARFLHMPAQSGSDKVLRDMNRGYTAEQYLDIVRMARSIVPDISITSDWIVGFATETDADFQQSMALLEQARPNSSYIFKYSTRPGTYALKWGDPVPEEVKNRRLHTLGALQEKISLQQQQAEVGSVASVLVEGLSKTNKARLSGRDARHKIVAIESADERLIGRLVPVRIRRATALTLFGDVAV